MSTFRNIKAGDRVTFWQSQGAGQPRKLRTAPAQALLIFPYHVVVNLGGKHGRPAVVDATNYESHKGARS